ncbi:YitT family protein [Mycoplasmopsis anatis]|uniref:DUF2179 domain-containing protein n=2 Tax=Mycoplasmopsis anatis TaxID=171279 RepID=F9QED6_9BACT|nr:YitT family protein [Mycoplasmopsis anatis]AWX70316.1 YitT family protein [Mycoplasmopsis anatis]EGS28863.1 hypothetical protein GIG_03759 [Mycoplasmopsis anatis 1340]MBW0594411.1 YitT family protein [Mycoplasmopsis anatis]MBW0595265.1 YitT family protein [Mycoplasmopsis anatis]MBW0596305.1 YitT family protein [Mycoplasmopsis anatis]
MKKDNENLNINKSNKKTKKESTQEHKIRKKNAYQRVKVKSSVLYFSQLYNNKSNFKQVLLIIFIGILYGTCLVFLVQNTGLYELGLSAIGQSIGRLTQFLLRYNGYSVELSYFWYNLIFWILYFILNIPLLLLSYKYLSKRFFYFTILFLFVQTLVGLVIGFIPSVEDVFIFANLNKGSPVGFTDYAIYMTLWNSSSDATKQVSIILYGLAWGSLNGVFTGALFILESCSGGFDILGTMIAKKKHKDLGQVLTILNVISLIFANLIGNFIPAIIALNTEKIDTTQVQENTLALDVLFSPNFLAGLGMMAIFQVCINLIFPRYKTVQVQIFAKEYQQLLNTIYENSSSRFSFSVSKVIGSYSKQEQFMIFTNCMYIDAADLISLIREYDKNILITVIDIKKTDGYIYVNTSL